MSLQIQGKYILDGAIDGDKLKLKSGQAIKLVKADGTTEVRLIEFNEATGEVLVDGQVVALKSQLDAETAAREAADTSLSTSLQAVVQAEADARTAADTALDARLDVIEGADTVEGSVAKAEKDAKDYADAAVLVEKTRAETAEAELESRLDVVQGPETQAGSIAKALKDAKDYVNDVIGVSSAAVAAFASLAEQMADGSAATGVISALGSVETRMDTAESDISAVEGRMTTAEGDIDSLETRMTAAEGDIEALQSASSGLQSELDATQTGAGLNSNGSYSAPSSSNYLSSASSLKDADSKLDAQIKSVADALAQEVLDRAADVGEEETRALGAEGALSGRLDVIEGTGEGSVAKAEADAKAYTDAEVAIEKTRAEGAEAALDGRLDTLEARLHRKMKFVLTSTDVSNGFIELAHEAMANSITASVGRLMIHEGASDDFTVSVVGGKTRMTFVGNLVDPGQEKLAAGDIIFVKYMNV